GGVRVKLLVDGFIDQTVAVSAGTDVDIENMVNTVATPRLYSPGDANLFKDVTLAPGAIRTIKPAAANKVYEVYNRDTGHRVGRIIAFPDRYAAAMRDGKFTIKDVPEGTWKVRIWHGTGFVKMDDQVLKVPKHGEIARTIGLPGGLAPGGK
ncbi:MAG TPA: hypothetical protein VL172_09505, partial [Kofleriaceae bacterium]|nr:hypothetical protein [Kofleriaceae bacterium]